LLALKKPEIRYSLRMIEKFEMALTRILFANLRLVLISELEIKVEQTLNLTAMN
jgi:hypothetical protein